MFEEIIEKNNQINAKLAQLKAEVTEHSKKILKEATASYFTKYGHLVASISWTQYTPYFNDGSPCEFGVSEPVLRWKAENPEDDDGDYSEGSVYALCSTDLSVAELERELSDVQEYYADPLAWSKNKLAKYRTSGSSYYKTLPDNYYVQYPPFYDTVKSVTHRLERAKTLTEEFKRDTNDILSLISSVSEESMRDAFGDHVQVIITAEQVIVEEYDHD